METYSWLITRTERGNPDTRLDAGHDDGAAWSEGNRVQPLVHGAAYFTALADAVGGMGDGDLLMFTDWRGDPDEVVDESGTTIGGLLTSAAERGVLVCGLVWRSHMDGLRFSAKENRTLSRAVNVDNGHCLLDMRVRPFGSHHQKFVVLRHRDRPERDAAFVGGIDLCHGRRDDVEHSGDPQPAPMADEFGKRPPWHDIQLLVRGPAVHDVETVFRERWTDHALLSRNPLHGLRAMVAGASAAAVPLPEQFPPPKPCGTHTVQLLRTYPNRIFGYPFARRGERSIARAYAKALSQARELVYVEDQYLWSKEVAEPFAEALRRSPHLRMIVVLPLLPAEDGRFARSAMTVGRNEALDVLYRAGGERVAVYGLENDAGVPVYVHAKAVVIDDVWACVGSDNLNMRSWTHDSELSCVVFDVTPDRRDPLYVGDSNELPRLFARDLRLRLSREHLAAEGDEGLMDPGKAFQAFAESAADLDRWHDAGRSGPRPRGRLRRHPRANQSSWTNLWAAPVFRRLFDPDGRPRSLRRLRAF